MMNKNIQEKAQASSKENKQRSEGNLKISSEEAAEASGTIISGADSKNSHTPGTEDDAGLTS